MKNQQDVLDSDQLSPEWKTKEKIVWSSNPYFPVAKQSFKKLMGAIILIFIMSMFLFGVSAFLFHGNGAGFELISALDKVFVRALSTTVLLGLGLFIYFSITIKRKVQFAYSKETLFYKERKLLKTSHFAIPFSQIENISLHVVTNETGSIRLKPKTEYTSQFKKLSPFPALPEIPRAKQLYLELKEVQKEAVLLLENKQ